MRGLLVRVAADQSEGGGSWNAPIDSRSGQFVYVAIPECSPVLSGMNKPYSALTPALHGLGSKLPPHLSIREMHLDPDFDYLTYGAQGQRARQIQDKCGKGDLIVFYAELRDIHPSSQLVYAIIGLYFVDSIEVAVNVPISRRHENAHSRRVLPSGAADIIVRARLGESGRLERCIPIGEYRDRAYRVRRDLLNLWGGLTMNDGYLQRSTQLPQFRNAKQFYDWFLSCRVKLLARNN